MIKINLLPYRAARRKEIITKQIIVGAVPLLITIIIIGFFWWSINAQNVEAQENIRGLQEKIKQSRLKMKDIDTFKEQKATLAKKMEIIQTLEKKKTGPVRMLDEIASSLPGNLWLTKLDQKGTTLILDGRSLDNISISRYMVLLEESQYFGEVMLGEIKTDSTPTAAGALLKTFKLNAKVTYNLEAEPGI